MRLAVAAALFTALAGLPAHALEITNVSHSPAALDVARKVPLSVRFRLTESARVALRIYDGRDLLIREVSSRGVLPSGDATLVWNGRDVRGEPVPPEAYVYTLIATPAEGKPVEWDVTDLSGNEEIAATGVRWDPKAHLVHYELPSAARVLIRGGLGNGGPLLRGVVQWVARTAGPHAETWNGKDESGLIDASNHPDLQVSVQAWQLPRNAIIVLPERPSVELISGLDAATPRRARKRDEPLRERAIDQQPIERRADVHIRLSLPRGTKKGADGTLVASGRLPIELDVEPKDRARLLEQRFEVGFFVDGKYVFENEVGFLPMTWVWDAGSAGEGVHYVTGNVWGYSGQFGTATIAVRIAPE